MPTSAAVPATPLHHLQPSSGGAPHQQSSALAVSASSLSETARKQHLFSTHHDNSLSMGHQSFNSSAVSIATSSNSTTNTAGSNSSGCGRSGCSGAILVMFPSSPSRPSTVGTIRANVRTGGSSFASSPTAASSSLLVNGDNTEVQKFCACERDDGAVGLNRTTPNSPTVSMMDGSSYINSSLKSGSYLGSSGLGTDDTPNNADYRMEVEIEDEPEAQLYIDTQLANLDFHTPSSHSQSQKRLSSNGCAVSHSPISSNQFSSHRNRSNTNPHSQSIFSSSSSPVPNYFSSSFDGAKSPLSLKAMVNNNTINSQSNHQASAYHPLSPARVPRPLGTFRRYHAHSISGNSAEERANPANNHHRSHQSFSRTAAMNSMHNARSIDSAGNFGHAHPSNTTSVDLSRTALLIREVG